MALSLKKESLKRYKDFVWLLMKYGKSDLAQQLGSMDNGYGYAREEMPATATDNKAEELADDLEKLGPTFIKLGQFLSTRPDLIPEAYINGLTRLQDKVEPIPLETIKEIITNELGVKISRAFSYFDEKPLAAASLSQVHLANLRDSRQVAVKVQRPNIRVDMMLDLDAMADVAEMLENNTEAGKKYRPFATIEEFRKAVLRELDFQIEARNLTTMRENLKEFEDIIIPAPVNDYTTSKVLTMDYVHGKKVTSLSPLRRMEIDGYSLAEELFRAYLHQILIDGFYHADPHPGNIFLTDNNKIALIDLGMVAYISPFLQKKLLQTLVDVSEAKGDKVAKSIIDISEVSEGFDETGYYRKIDDLVSTYGNLPLNELEVGRALLEVAQTAGESGVRFPNELAMLGKALLSLDKVGRALDPKFNPNESVRKNAEELYRKKLSKDLSSKNFYNSLVDLKDLVTNMPERVNRILENISNNQFTFRVDAFDEKYLMTGLQKIANRLTIGMILSALIIGAALMMKVDTPFKVFSYPGIAMLFFLLAGLGGIYLAIKMFISDEPTRKKPHK